MGLKEGGLRGSLRNVSVGMAAIPDDGVYLQDDWGDGKLTDRDDANTREQTIFGETFDTRYRPEWAEQAGTPSASSSEDGFATVGEGELIRTGTDWTEGVWEWEFEWQNVQDSGGRRAFEFELWREDSDNYIYVRVAPDSSDGTFRLEEDIGGSTDVIISDNFANDEEKHTLRVERDESTDDWELFLDGESRGTGSQNPNADPIETGLAAGRGTEVDMRVYNLKFASPDAFNA